MFNSCSIHRFSYLLVLFSENNLLSKAAEINILLFTVYCISCFLWVLKLCQFPNLHYSTLDVRHIVNYEQCFLSLRCMLFHEETSHRGEWNDTPPLGIFRYLVY